MNQHYLNLVQIFLDVGIDFINLVHTYLQLLHRHQLPLLKSLNLCAQFLHILSQGRYPEDVE